MTPPDYARLFRGYIFSIVAERGNPGTRPGRTDGQVASIEQLRRQLGSAPLPFLEGAVRNPALGDEEMVLLLRNPRATPALLHRIGADHRWTRSYEVKKTLVQHPKTPLVVARNLVPHLHWKELSEVSANLRVNPVVRRQAEELLKTRIEELSVGERISLARRASRGVIGGLLDSNESPVLRALLGNARLVEIDAVKIASAPTPPGDLFRYLSEHPKWGVRRAVRLALAKNPRVPIAVALKQIGRLAPRDLRQLSKDAKVPKIVRVGADRRLAKSSKTRDG